jgi:hypothetical protein
MPEDLSFWKDQIQKAKQYQDHKGRLKKWERYRKWYRNEYPPDVVSVNRIFATGRALVPQLYFKAPTIVVRPRKPGFERMAKILESVDAWLIDHIGFKQQIKMLILDSYIVNIGVGKIGYHTISTELPTPSDETTEALADFLGAPVRELSDELVRRRWSYHDYVKPDSPWFLRVRPQDILVPWGFVDEHETPWVAFRIVRPLEDVKHDPVYHNVSRLQPNVRPQLELTATISPNLHGQLQGQEFVELFEIWDKRDGKVRVLSMDHDKWLRNEEHNMDIVGAPCVVLRFNPDGEDFWGVSDVEQIHKQQLELNENRTHEIETKRLANVKGIVDTNVIPEEELQKLEKGKPGPLVRSQGSPAAAFAEWKLNVPADLYRIDEIIDKDFREIIGFSRNQSGEFEVSRRTATEAQIVREAFLLRADERRDMVADLIAETFRDKIHPLIFQNWSAERVIQVTALGGWVKFTGEQIRGDYDVVVIPDSVLPLSKKQEQQMAVEAFTLFRGDPRIRQEELYRQVLQRFRELIPDPDMLLVPEQEVQRAALLQALQQGAMQRARTA